MEGRSESDDGLFPSSSAVFAEQVIKTEHGIYSYNLLSGTKVAFTVISPTDNTVSGSSNSR